MFEQEVTVKNKTGLHARPASQLMSLCQKYKSNIKIIKGNKTVNPKSIISLLGGGITQGSKIIVRIEGADEQEAGEAIVSFIDSLEE